MVDDKYVSIWENTLKMSAPWPFLARGCIRVGTAMAMTATKAAPYFNALWRGKLAIDVV